MLKGVFTARRKDVKKLSDDKAESRGGELNTQRQAFAEGSAITSHRCLTGGMYRVD